MKLYCDPLAGFVEIPEHPRCIVSLASGLTEALVLRRHGGLFAGVSVWCPNFMPGIHAPIVGDYLKSGSPTPPA
jgi:hypothetical protein